MNLKEFRAYSVVITDTSRLIVLDKINGFDILHKTFANIVTTSEIQKEYGLELPSWLQVREVKDVMLKEVLSASVDEGEASAIALAMETSNPILILDDLKGRKLASQMSLDFIGTLGLLIKAKEYGVIPAVRPYIEKMQTTNFRISPSLVNLILEKTGEK